MLVFTHDKDRLWEHFRNDQVLFAYHIGDLDDFYFEHCQWAAWFRQSGRIDECVLVYSGLPTPCVLAFGAGQGFGALLEETLDLLPARFYCHYLKADRDILAGRFKEASLGTHQKMRLVSYQKKHTAEDTRSLVRLDESHAGRLQALYERSYPGNYFDLRMLESGKYFGYVAADRLLAVAGIHVYSTKYKIAVLGNIVTSPEHRGQGLATRVTSRLVEELADEGLMVALNVKADNVAAIRCYESLGFAKTHEYEEGLFESVGRAD